MFEHKVRTDQVNPNGTTTLVSSFYKKSYDIDLDTGGTGEFFLSMRRFLPDFKTLQNNAKVTLAIKDIFRFRQHNSLSRFLVTSSTQKKRYKS